MPLQYRIEGSDLQYVEMVLAPGESAVGEPGAMMYADAGVSIDTRMGDGSDAGFGERLAAGFKRSMTGENFFTSIFTNNGQRPLRVAFAAPSPGKIIAVDLASVGGTLICQKGAFLGGTKGIKLGLAFKKRLRAGFFGGEGFIMQKLTGNGTVFIHASGTLAPLELRAGEELKVDTGCLAALQSTVNYDVKYVGSLKTSVLGGEGLFLASLKGPGTVWLQSLPIQRLRATLVGGVQSRGVGPKIWYFLVVIFIVIATIMGEQT
ncbi:MAG TPA: TIGR00266 family protein [Steroidobacteraceae bacterium]|nr:TIGR00266 family protein [Steroidobacteraceae bacterium]